jgi:lipopolysaccharide biosynthesis glycosyltransferase
MGVQCLYRSLQAVQSKHPLIVMYTPDTLTPQAAITLKTEGCIMHPVKRYFPPVSAAVDHSLYKMECYTDCWSKLLMWEMEDYDILVYLDADMLVLRNIDFLFHLPMNRAHGAQTSTTTATKPLENGVAPHLWAVPDCAAGRPTEEERAQCSLLPHKIENRNKDANKKSQKSARQHCYSYFNAGMFIFSPSITQLHNFTETLSSGTCPIQGYAEQDFLNHYFKETWQPLSTLFNLQKGIRGHHPELWYPEDAFIIHYTDCKPWQGRHHPENVEYSEIVDWWWATYNINNGRGDGDGGKERERRALKKCIEL